jgi:hypothetical protein
MEFFIFLLEPQYLMKFRENDPDCTWMTSKLMRKNLEIQICVFLALFQEFDLNFDFG